MRNCLAKLTHMFRRKSTDNQQQLEQYQQPECAESEGATTTSNITSTSDQRKSHKTADTSSRNDKADSNGNVTEQRLISSKKHDKKDNSTYDTTTSSLGSAQDKSMLLWRKNSKKKNNNNKSNKRLTMAETRLGTNSGNAFLEFDDGNNYIKNDNSNQNAKEAINVHRVHQKSQGYGDDDDDDDDEDDGADPNQQRTQNYIDEYKTFVEEKQLLIQNPTPYPKNDQFHYEEALNLGTFGKRQSIQLPGTASSYQSKPTNSSASMYEINNSLKLSSATPTTESEQAKTPEEIEYEQKVAAEVKDIMTPLPFANARTTTQPELIDIIRNLDAHALRLNNLTNDERKDLIQRLDKQQQRRRSRSNNLTLSALENHLNSDSLDSLAESESDTVVLRDKTKYLRVEQRHSTASGLYERRQPRGPKLRLQLKSDKDSDESRISDLERNLMDLKYPTVLPPNPQLKALLVFHKSDNICEVVTQACHRQQLDVTVVRTKEAALDTLSNTNAATESYHLIVIDARSTKYLDAEYIARSIRHTCGHNFTTIIAVVKKSFFEKDDVLIALLDAGVNRCMAETTSLTMCTIELKQILHSIVRPHNVMSTQQALYTALHRLKEVLIITDDVLRIQYANKSAERLLNMRLDEIISKPLADIFISDVSSINTHGKFSREFDGILTVRRKSQDGIPMHVRVVPVACIGRTPTHYVFNFDVPGGQSDFIATLPQPKEAPRGSLHSIRRGSFDVRSVASDGLRRTSLAKLTSLPLEAPITKENCSADEARLIDKVLEFLKREGLYSPQMKEIRTDDPIATDLIGALLTGPSLYSSRRSSNDSIIRVSSRPSGIMPAKMKATPLIMELLEESLSWEFDIFKLEDITEKRPLLYLGMEMFRRFDVFATFNVEENICKSWLAVIEANYHAQNSYHNSTHAADVMQATGAFITQLAVKDMVMDRMDEATALIAAAAHDIDHPGRSSAFLCNSNSPLAILYNDLTVLESHHAATTFKLTLGDDKINIFKNLDKETYKSVRSTIIDMILATEMTRHFEHLAKFVSVFGTDVEPRDIVQTEDESSILIRRMLIKVADVSNPARPTAYCVEWARRIAEEYFMQTDEEKANALPIVMPMFDRATCSIPKSQIGFIEYIIQDMMHAWDSFIDMPQLITYMQINYSQWKKYEDQGIHTLADIKAKLVSLNLKKTTCK